jgi:hypothetical protein
MILEQKELAFLAGIGPAFRYNLFVFKEKQKGFPL